MPEKPVIHVTVGKSGAYEARCGGVDLESCSFVEVVGGGNECNCAKAAITGFVKDVVTLHLGSKVSRDLIRRGGVKVECWAQ